MNILAIESSCDETAAAVVADGRWVLSNVLASQANIHKRTGGVVPEVAARLQLESIGSVVDKAITNAQVGWDEIDALAVTYGPGLIGSLMVGVQFAKTLAYAKGKPLIPVNHLAGHIYACLHDQEFRFPYLALVVSGGHTELVEVRDHGNFHLLGSTRDDAAGEAFDKTARLLGLTAFMGGPAISQLAEQGDAQSIPFPRAMIDQDNLDFSFSGLKTAVRREVEAEPLTDQRKADIAASFEMAVVDALVIKTVRAANRVNPSAVLLGGGVAANRLLRHKLQSTLQENNIPLLPTPPELATDNAAMIGLTAFWTKGLTSRSTVVADPGARLAPHTA